MTSDIKGDAFASQLDWICGKCHALFPDRDRPSKRRLKGLLTTPATAVQQEGVQKEVSTVAALLALMDLRAARWISRPDELQLPMVGFVPGLGWGMVVGRDHEGHWRFETFDTVQMLDEVPAQSVFTAVAPVNVAGVQGKTTARAMFRQALFAHKKVFAWAAVAALVGNLLALGGSLYSMQVYDRVMSTHGVSTLVVLTIGAALAALLELLIKMARSGVMEHSVKGMDLSLSHHIFKRLLSIRMDQFPSSVGSLSSQLRSYEQIRAFMSSATMYFAVDTPFALLFVAVIAMLAGPAVAAVPVVFFLLSMAVSLFYRGKIVNHAQSGNALANRKLGLLVETVEGAESIKAFGSRWRQQSQWDLVERAATEEGQKMRRYSEHASYIGAFIQQASYISLVGVGAYLAVTDNTLTSGSLIACSILSGRVLTPVAALPGLIVQWANARAALETLEKVFALELDNHAVANPLAPEKVVGDYEINDLQFSYPGRPQSLQINSLRIRAGEKVAILGAIGAGKSTLLKVLAGLYHPRAGRVLLDGLDIQQISRGHMSEHVGYSPQDIRLVAGSLRDNLLAGLHGVSEQQVLDACRLTGLATVVASHPQGLDLEIAEGGSGLSGGQKQLVGMTRLLLARPDVWLIDEPTASMDDGTEARCLQALSESIGVNQTLVVVTHKMALLSLVDRIVVLGPQGVLADGPKQDVLRAIQAPARPVVPTPPSTPAGNRPAAPTPLSFSTARQMAASAVASSENLQ
ncbi:ATP-binding cassette domain-containing protein [Pseudomonas fluorescens]|uniref:Vitamin B12 import ATP-binding protein BtuD n=1 Tax=Pseudomonas fluorescens TaxID=294 RepID=A0A5E7PZ18_PSEFL|nr:ATP-binding cassette domain-containing protein [Pseudomonas fluorescens]VVP55156.1 Vitamin B12 import ATP-binding protein BtuD [Pseudomonas fluorescens]